jgi:hypothetical protein
MPGWQGTHLGGRVRQHASYADVYGALQFADKPRDAPVIHFGGPWQVTLCDQPDLVIGRDVEVVLAIGTPGLGAGTTTYIDYEGVIPEKVYPTLEVTYPPGQKSKVSVRERYVLKRRC